MNNRPSPNSEKKRKKGRNQELSNGSGLQSPWQVRQHLCPRASRRQQSHGDSLTQADPIRVELTLRKSQDEARAAADTARLG